MGFRGIVPLSRPSAVTTQTQKRMEIEFRAPDGRGTATRGIPEQQEGKILTLLASAKHVTVPDVQSLINKLQMQIWQYRNIPKRCMQKNLARFRYGVVTITWRIPELKIFLLRIWVVRKDDGVEIIKNKELLVMVWKRNKSEVME